MAEQRTAAFSEERRESLVRRVMAHVTESRLREAVVGMTAIPSPTGHEAPLAQWLAARMADAGLETEVQHLDEHQANAIGRLRGDGTGPDLMLYAPLDTLTVGAAEYDLPWIGERLRGDMLPAPFVHGPYVTGLGASNTKGHGACILSVAEALAAVRPALRGDLIFAFGAGGMPTNAIAGVGTAGRANTGHGAGCSFLLERGCQPDYAVIAKPGDFLSHQEVGLCWFEVTVPGVHTYVGSRHRLPYRNPIVTAAEVVKHLEDWLDEYPTAHRTETCLPQGIIASIRGGWERMLAVTPAACRVRMDVRITPGTPPLTVKRELAARIQALSAELGVALGLEMVLAIPGSSTDPWNWIIRSGKRSWEVATGRVHQPVPDNSGATDANILRWRGIPTARVGMPKVSTEDFEVDFQRGMNTVDVRDMRRLAEILLRIAVDSTSRTRDEIHDGSSTAAAPMTKRSS